MAKAYFKIDGMKELQNSINKLGKVPQKQVTASAKEGMNLVKKDAKAKAPVDTGNLRKGIIIVGEKSKDKGKKIYRVVFDRKLNNVFQKKAKYTGTMKRYDGHIRSVKHERFELNISYYPVSMEYGFFTVNGKWIPGYKFGHKSLDENKEEMSKRMIKSFQRRMNQEIVKMRLEK